MRLVPLLAILLLTMSTPAQARFDSLFRHYGGERWQWFKAQAMAESAMNPRAVSHVGASGLTQFMVGRPPRHLMAWAAGFMDGEGTIAYGRQVNKANRSGYAYQPFVCASQVDEAPLKKIRDILRTGYIEKRNRQNNDTNQRDCYAWCVRGAGVFPVIKLLRPYLVVKVAQADLLIERENYLKRKIGSKVSDDDQAVMQTTYDEMKVLNARGVGAPTHGVYEPGVLIPSVDDPEPSFFKTWEEVMPFDSDPFDPEQSIIAQVKYMDRLLKAFEGDWRKALAAYNCGPGRVARLVAKHGDGWFEKLPEETRGYVPRIERYYAEYKKGDA